MPVSNMQGSLKRLRALRLAGIAALATIACGQAFAQSDDQANGDKTQTEAQDGQTTDPGNATVGEGSNATDPARSQDEQEAAARNAGTPDAETLLGVNVNTIWPGSVSGKQDIQTPAMDQAAAEAGMDYFNTMNCIGCHAPNGAGGMGPALSNDVYIYGGEPAEIFLTIKQGRPNGMPAYGTMLPDAAIWQLVAYVKSISKDPDAKNWGTTVSLDTMTIEQVPAEYQDTADPWSNTKPFSFGQDPYENGEPPQSEASAAGSTNGEKPSDVAEGLSNKNQADDGAQPAAGNEDNADSASQ